jgi:hypothetical protein
MLFDAYLTHESLQCEPDDIPCTSDPVWVLGKKYDARKGNEKINFFKVSPKTCFIQC